MSIVIRGYSGTAIATWGYGDLLIQLLHPRSGIVAAFTKLTGKLTVFEITNNKGALIERVVSETSPDEVVNPSSGDLQVIPTVSVSFIGLDRVVGEYISLNTIEALMDRVISEEPIVQIKNPSTGDLQVIPTVGVTLEKSDAIAVNHEISDKIKAEFIRIIAEEP